MNRKKAGHRSWSLVKGRVKGFHRGDIMSKEKRSAVMKRIRSKNTKPEISIFKALKSLNIKFEKHPKDLPGKPDVVLRNKKIAFFIDGDFWHGWRFPLWKHKLSKKWKLKIIQNRLRDRRNFRSLRKNSWKVIRIWEHQIENSHKKDIENKLKLLLKKLRSYPTG